MAYKKYARTCDECGKGFNDGYCVEGGMAYYCTDACLYKNIAPEKWEEMSADDDSDSYWTTWGEAPDEYLVDEDDPAPNRLSVELADAYELVDVGFYEGITALFRKQLRDRGLDPDRYNFDSWTVNCQVQIKGEDKA